MKSCFYLMLSIVFLTAYASAQTTAPKAPTVTAPTVKAPGVTAPTIPAPQPPQANGPSGAPQSRGLLPAAPLIATKFDEGAYKQQTEAGSTVMLVFAETGDPIWAKQAPALQGLMKEPEFGRIAVFQIDIGATPAIADRFLVKIPGTLLMMKGGVERLRSTRMTKPDAIRKMLRLHAVL
jgi:hypothetical protein